MVQERQMTRREVTSLITRSCIVIGIVAFIITLSYLASFGIFPDWIGLSPPRIEQGKEVPRGVTIWDWLQILVVPFILAFGAVWLNSLQKQREEKREAEHIQDSTLHAYFDQMTQLLLHEGLQKCELDAEVRMVARARTLTVLRLLEGVRKAIVVRFLWEAGLIQKDSSAALFELATLSGINLSNTHLIEANLRGAHLIHTDLTGAFLNDADLSGADLTGADLRKAILLNTKFNNAYYADKNTPKEVYALVYRGDLIEVDPRPTIFPDNFNPKEMGMLKIETLLGFSKTLP
ncbi:MAG: pentapeptide repeat-containing protein [Gammaproteobacteria bacterium]